MAGAVFPFPVRLGRCSHHFFKGCEASESSVLSGAKALIAAFVKPNEAGTSIPQPARAAPCDRLQKVFVRFNALPQPGPLLVLTESLAQSRVRSLSRLGTVSWWSCGETEEATSKLSHCQFCPAQDLWVRCCKRAQKPPHVLPGTRPSDPTCCSDSPSSACHHSSPPNSRGETKVKPSAHSAKRTQPVPTRTITSTLLSPI